DVFAAPACRTPQANTFCAALRPRQELSCFDGQVGPVVTSVAPLIPDSTGNVEISIRNDVRLFKSVGSGAIGLAVDGLAALVTFLRAAGDDDPNKRVLAKLRSKLEPGAHAFDFLVALHANASFDGMVIMIRQCAVVQSGTPLTVTGLLDD